MEPVANLVPDPGCLADLRATLRVLRTQPLLPVMSVAVCGLPPAIPQLLAVLALPLGIFSIGWPGTERLWVLRGFRGVGLTFEPALSTTGRYIGRFFRLGVLVAPLPIAGVIAGGLGTRT